MVALVLLSGILCARPLLAATHDTTPPTCAIISPTTGEAIAGTNVLEATAEDNAPAGVQDVGFYWDVGKDGADAEDFVGAGSLASGNIYQCTWDSVDAVKGYQPLIVQCTDYAGNVAAATDWPKFRAVAGYVGLVRRVVRASRK